MVFSSCNGRRVALTAYWRQVSLTYGTCRMADLVDVHQNQAVKGWVYDNLDRLTRAALATRMEWVATDLSLGHFIYILIGVI